MTHVCARGHVGTPDARGRCPRCDAFMVSIVAMAAAKRKRQEGR